MGFWIFASVALFSTVFLYTKTKDQWNWKKIILWAFGMIAAAISAFFLLIFWDNIFPKDISGTNYKGHLTSYNDIKIGSSISDVQFRHGTLKQEKPYPNDKFDLYTLNDEMTIYVDKDGKVNAIAIYCDNGNIDKFNGIGCGDPSEKLVKQFGADLKILCKAKDKNGWSPVEVSRSYDVEKYGTRYILSKNKVQHIGILQNEDFVGDKSKWGLCE